MHASKPVLAITAALATAVLAYFGTGLTPFWPLLWFAPVPVLIIVTGLRTFPAFLVALLAWFLGELNQWTYFTQVLGIPLPVVVFFFLIPAALFALGVLFTRSFLLRQSPILGALAFPTYWVTWEYLSAMTSPHSTFGNLGYSQMSCLALIQVASITGIWGLSFVVLLFAATVAALLSGAGQPSRRRILALGVGALLCAIFIFGEWRLIAKPAAKSVTVTLLAKDVPMSTYLGSEEQGLRLLAEYANEVSRVTPLGTEIVVLPEKIARVNENSLAQIDALFAAAGRATRSAIDLGIVRRTADGSYNSSRYYGRDGKVVANYDKHHLLPGVEPEKPGTHRVALDQSAGRWGLQICKDMDFPKLSREYAADGVNLLLVPAWDFQLDRWLHARMAVLRAVENGFALARSARNGLLTLADSRGRIVAEKPTLPDQFVALTGRVSVSTGKTFYSQTGDWFAWLCGASFVLLLGHRLLRGVDRLKG
jgi:apolipoprotein N-acyltransferase